MTSDRRLLARLSLEEKVSLLSGEEFWSLPALPSIGLEPIVMSDGPTGVKGGDESVRSPRVPCGTALAATWNPTLVEEVGAILGEAARAKGVHVLLAPATNMLRSPLAGRTFEYYSEDPVLAAAMTCAYVRGVQREGVAATVKHFVCHDAETSRESGSVELDEQTLREIYLPPFELAVREAGAWAVMCSYNRLRGTYLSAHPLLDELLRDEWGFTGVVVSDWGAVHETVPSQGTGVDVEMPGPPTFRGPNLTAAVRSGVVPEQVIDEKVLRILQLARRTGALGRRSRDRRRRRSTTETTALLRRAAAESFVLLKNEGALLPLSPVSRIVVLGRVAAAPPLQGGGSSNVGPILAPSPLESIRALAGGSTEVHFEPGYVSSILPRLDLAWVEALHGTPGFTVELHDPGEPNAEPFESETQRTTLFIFREVIAGRRLADVLVRIRATLTPPRDGEYVFGVNCSGAGTLRIAGASVLDLEGEHSLDWSYLFRPESRGLATVPLEGGKPVPFELDYRMTPGPAGEVGLVTLRARAPEPENLLERAVEAARRTDVAVVVTGLGEEYECEGYDRSSLDLPQEQRELIVAVAGANPRTVVVVSAGGPVSLDWTEEVPAILVVWYGGEELGPALADVLFGRAEPGGRLPMTFPARPEDAPVLDPAPDDQDSGAWHYREGLFVGHRHYDRYGFPPAHCFGHGLGYAHFEYEAMRVERNGREVEVAMRLRNASRRRGKEVVQLYVSSADTSRPPLELKAFEPVELAAGADAEVTFTLGARAFSKWDDEERGFLPIPGEHEIAVGSSSRDLRLRTSFTFS